MGLPTYMSYGTFSYGESRVRVDYSVSDDTGSFDETALARLIEGYLNSLTSQGDAKTYKTVETSTLL